MRKLLLIASTVCITLTATAQDLATKIPSTATAVVTLKGKRITDLVSVEEFSNSKLGEMIGKELAKESDEKVNNLEEMGLALDQNFYYFLEMDKGVFNNCFLIPLKNSQGLLNLMGNSQRERIITENGLSYFQDDYDGSVVLWDNSTLLVLFAKDTSNDYDFYDDYGYNDYGNDNYGDALETPTPAVVEEEVEIETIVEEAAEEVAIDAESEIVEETVIDIEEVVIESTEPTDNYYNDYYNSEEYKKQEAAREKRRLEREAKRAEKRKKLAEATLQRAKTIIAGNYTQGNILKNAGYVKTIGNGQDEAVAWVDDFGSIYKDAMMGSYYGAMNPYNFMDMDKLYGGFSISAKLNFEKDHASVKTIYSMNDELADIYRPMYQGKFNSNFAKYINEDRLLGYWSINMSTEGLLTSYPQLMDAVFKTEGEKNYGDVVALGTQLFSLLLDEKATAEIVRGDMLLVLNNLSEREVTYTDYEYDEDYNYKEVVKTKTETVPDFLFMFSSEQKSLFDRLVRIGLREKELQAIGGIYQIVSLPQSSPFDIYVMFKDNTAFVGSSKKDMMAISNGTFASKLSSTHKRNMKKNVTSLFVNGKKIVAEIPVDSYPSELRNKVSFLTNNTEDVYFNFEKIKGNTMKGEMIWNTPEEGHKNSFAYFINMINRLME